MQLPPLSVTVKWSMNRNMHLRHLLLMPTPLSVPRGVAREVNQLGADTCTRDLTIEHDGDRDWGTQCMIGRRRYYTLKAISRRVLLSINLCRCLYRELIVACAV